LSFGTLLLILGFPRIYLLGNAVDIYPRCSYASAGD
jgi:hypothetical protein